MRHETSFYIEKQDYFIYAFSIYTLIFCIFQPSLLEFIGLGILDFLCITFSIYLDKKFRKKLYPNSEDYFPQLNEEVIARYIDQEKSSLILKLMDFPRQRSMYILIISNLKSIPSLIFIVYFWEHANESHLEIWIKVLGMVSILFLYYYASVYIAVHNNISKNIAYLHHKYDFSKAFSGVTVPNFFWQFRAQEGVALGALVFLTLSLTTISLLSIQDKLDYINVIIIITICLLLLIRIYFNYRQFFYSGLQDVVEFLEEIQERRYEKVPLHTSSTLAKFEKSINQMIDWLENSNKEIESWIVHETQQSRIRSLGEMSALIAHDLLGPLHTIQFCTEELSEKSGEEQKRYLQVIEKNLQRSISLVESIKAQLKNPENYQQECPFITAHEYALELILMYFRPKQGHQVHINLDSKLNEVLIKIGRSHLVHIFYNIYKNGFENLLDNHIENPTISIKFVKEELGSLFITIHDNGTGLSKEMFEAMTSTKFYNHEYFYRSLGLRLTRRLVENCGGEMTILEQELQVGTVIQLILPGFQLVPNS